MGTTLGQRSVVVWLVPTGASALLHADLVSLPPLSVQPVPLVRRVTTATGGPR